jgi:hypothetical protein
MYTDESHMSLVFWAYTDEAKLDPLAIQDWQHQRYTSGFSQERQTFLPLQEFEKFSQ